MKPQLELGLDPATPIQPRPQQPRRLQRAHWWFDRMRQAVDRALDRRPSTEPRPEQIYFSLRRQTESH